MNDIEKASDLIKRLVKQVSGEIEPDDGDLVPSHFIVGSGYIWCFQPASRSFIRVPRGIRVYVLYKSYDPQGRHLIYSNNSEMVVIDPDELIEIGFN